MAVFRVNKSKNYTVMSNMHLQDKTLSLKAKGLLSVMFSLPENWDYSIRGLVAICKEGESAVSSAIDELKKAGYLKVTKIPPTSGTGQFTYIYDVYEQPLGGGFLGLEVLGLEVLGVENQGQLNTKEQSTNKQSTKRKNSASVRSVIDEYTSNEELRNAIDAFVRYRKESKHPLTDHGLVLMLKKLDGLAASDEEKKAILDQSVMYGWRGIFPVKNNVNKKDDGDYNAYL